MKKWRQRGKNKNLFTSMANQTLPAYWISFCPSELRLYATSSMKPYWSSPQLLFSSPIS